MIINEPDRNIYPVLCLKSEHKILSFSQSPKSVSDHDNDDAFDGNDDEGDAMIMIVKRIIRKMTICNGNVVDNDDGDDDKIQFIFGNW